MMASQTTMASLTRDLLGNERSTADSWNNLLPYHFRPSPQEVCRFGVFVGFAVKTPCDHFLANSDEDLFVGRFLTSAKDACEGLSGSRTLADCGFAHVSHQADGTGCAHLHFFVAPLRPHPEFEDLARIVCSSCWLGKASIAGLLAPLKAFGLELDPGFYDRAGYPGKHIPQMEGIYPIPATDKNIDLISSDYSALSSAISPLVPDADTMRRLAIYILADNSD